MSDNEMLKLAQKAWSDLVEKDDRTSPEDYPDMALITEGELREFMERASALRTAAASAEPVAWQWKSPGGTKWHTLSAPDDHEVRRALEAQGYEYRALYPAKDRIHE